jgi:adenosylhomocysteine nucleosidase
VSTGAVDARPVVAVTGLDVEARIATGPGIRTLAGGGDLRGLAIALDVALARGAAAIISFGMAGGLHASALPGTWIVANAVVTPTSRWNIDARWAAALARSLPGAVRGDIAGSDSIVAEPSEKRALGATTGALAVDMESHAVAAFASAHSLPFAVFRVIADPVTRALAPAALQGMRSDGTVNHGAVLGSVLRSPGQLPRLIRNAMDAQVALRELSRGRRLLGPGLDYPDF